jgi:hypothetical protein
MFLHKLKQAKRAWYQTVLQGQGIPCSITISHLHLAFIKLTLYYNDLSILV